MNSIMHTVWLSSSFPKNLLKQRQRFSLKRNSILKKRSRKERATKVWGLEVND